MQHPGRVSFKFINKMQLVSGSLLGTREQKGTGTRASWCTGQGGSAGPQSPLSRPPLWDASQEGPILLGQVAVESQLGQPVGL